MRSLKRLLAVIWSPGKAWDDFDEKDPYWIALLGLTIVYWIVGFLKIPFYMAAFDFPVPAGTDEREILASMMTTARVSVAAAPLIIWAKVLFFALIIWLVLLLRNIDLTLKSVFSVLVYCEIAAVAQEMVELGLLFIRGLDRIRTVLDVQFRFGIDLFLLIDSPVVTAALKEAQFFRIWWLLLIYFGMRKALQSERKVALLTVVGLLLFFAGLQALLVFYGPGP